MGFETSENDAATERCRQSTLSTGHAWCAAGLCVVIGEAKRLPRLPSDAVIMEQLTNANPSVLRVLLEAETRSKKRK